MIGGMRHWWVMAAAALAGCGEESAPPAQPFDLRAAARQVAEARLAEAVPGGFELRAVQAYGQTEPRLAAVCGQVRPREASAFVPFVSFVRYEAGRDVVAEVEQIVANTPARASRVYIEMVQRCFEGGGPPGGRGTQPLPPVPAEVPATPPPPPPSWGKDKVELAPVPGTGVPGASGPAWGSFGGLPPRPARPPGSEPGVPPAPQAAPQALSPGGAGPAESGMVTLRRHGNVHSGPAGRTPVIMVLPPGTVLRVFGTAPGGWLEVGETRPLGWLHGSLLGQ
jgi:hypothetical protein